MIKKNPLSAEQEFAADPTQNIWVQANAGTGKTSVLTERLLRILFRSDEHAGGILCLTYTNAAAGEMRNRILAALRQWALASDSDLIELLRGITINKEPTTKDITRARKIFFKYIDSPEILKIKTIHGFCEEILRRFPTEAGISPSWTLISDAPQQVLLNDALNVLMNSSHANPDLANAFDHIINVVSEYKIQDVLKYVEQQYKHFFMINDFNNYRDYFIENIKNKLNISDDIIDSKPVKKLKNILELAKSVKKAGKKLENLINLTEQYIENTIDFEIYKKAYLTNSGTPIVAGLNYDFLDNEKERVLKINAQHVNQGIYQDTIALFDLSAAFAKQYNELKRKYNLLDFEDLILYTHRLFSNPETMGWVLSQMDLSLSHILVDEAQDTGPLQWDILKMLAGDFFTDGDNTDIPHSLFVVGDTKQSIYGFQGADPAAFATSRKEIAAHIKNNVRDIKEVPLTQSFRSVEPILQVVDMFFGDKNVMHKTGFINNAHKCFRVGEPGVVEIHNLVSARDSEQEASIARHKYLSDIADKIDGLIASGKYQAGDIMVLLRQRTPMALPMTLELKRRGIPVAGSDRIVLPEYPIIRDLMNLLRFCMTNDDDYSLCCVLKSPMFRMTESDIYKICNIKNAADNKQTIYALLQTNRPEVYDILTNMLEAYKTSGPYTFFTYVLNNFGMREKMVATLGEQILDPLEEFLTICMAYERTKPGTLRHFIKWFITGNAEIKRDMDSGFGVRIVTVHGSKGLQAPVVFLIDTVTMPKTEHLYNIDSNSLMPLWVWAAHTPSQFSDEFEEIRSNEQQIATAENFRLLYVAMTRACDELYIYGFTPNTSAPELSWHGLLWQTLTNKPGICVVDDAIRITNNDK